MKEIEVLRSETEKDVKTINASASAESYSILKIAGVTNNLPSLQLSNLPCTLGQGQRGSVGCRDHRFLRCCTGTFFIHLLIGINYPELVFLLASVLLKTDYLLVCLLY